MVPFSRIWQRTEETENVLNCNSHEVSVIGHELGGKFIQKTPSLFLGYKKLVDSVFADKILSLPFTVLPPVKILYL